MNKALFISNAVRELPNTYNNALPVKGALMELAGMVYDSIKYKGTKTAAEVAAVVDPINGDAYRIITTGGNLNAGGDTLAVVVGDVVAWDGEAEIWVLFKAA